MHYSFCFSQALSIIWNEKLWGKKWISMEEVTQKQFWSTKHVEQPMLHFPVARTVIVPACNAQTASRVPKTQSVNLNVCVIQSPASISSPSFLTREGKSRWMQRERRRGCMEKKRWRVNWGEAHWNQQQSEDPEPQKHLRPHVSSSQPLCCVSFQRTSSSVTLRWWILNPHSHTVLFFFFPKHFHSWHAGETLSKACHLLYSSINTALAVTATSGGCESFWGRLADASWNCHRSEKHFTQDETGN